MASDPVASDEVLGQLERAALATLAKKAHEGDAVAARTLLSHLGKIRGAVPAPSPKGRISLVDDAGEARALIAEAKGTRVSRIEDLEVGDPPPVPGPDLEPADFLASLYQILAFTLSLELARNRTQNVSRMVSELQDLYAEMAKGKNPRRRSVWESDVIERENRFAAAMRTAPPELLDAALTEIQRRRHDDDV